MKKIYIITGASGHLGSTILRQLKKQLLSRRHSIHDIRGLILPTEQPPFPESARLHWYYGDVTDISSLTPLFENCTGYEVTVIHAAGIIDITASQVTDEMYAVNVEGTKNMIAAAMFRHIHRFLYISSVHAIPERPNNETITETHDFDPDLVVGGYAKTKAMATRLVLNSVPLGLPAIVVHPSGIIGPYDTQRNHMIGVIRAFITGKLPVCVRGGYDFVDVRDVASGCLLAVHFGKIGECYILSNKHFELKKMLESIGYLTGKKTIPSIPLWIAKLGIPFLSLGAKLRHQKPIYTRYSLYTLQSNGHFSHEKATKELGYSPRSVAATLKDTIRWLRLKKI